MAISDWTKLLIAALVCICVTFLGVKRVLDSQAVAAILSAVLGYVFGNSHGILSARNNIKR